VSGSSADENGKLWHCMPRGLHAALRGTSSCGACSEHFYADEKGVHIQPWRPFLHARPESVLLGPLHRRHEFSLGMSSTSKQ